MKTKLFFTYIFSLLFFNGYSDTGKYRLIVTDDPSTTMTIAWDQGTTTSDPILYYDITDHGTDFPSYLNSIPVTELNSAVRFEDYKGMDNRFVKLSGLTPNTNYYFIIVDSDGASQRFWFRTAPNDTSRLSFIAGGDSRNNRVPRQNANLLVSKLKPHAVLFGGDMTDTNSNTEWQEWFDDWQLTTASDGRMFPIVPARGNHESDPNAIYNLFDTPIANSYYAVTFGDDLIRIYTLNTEISILGDQQTWLQADLAASTGLTWKMAQYHKPMRAHTSSKAEGDTQYGAWAQLFYDEEVRLVIECDSHTSKTTWPVMPSSGTGNDQGFIQVDYNGTVYSGEGCWGAPLRSNDDDKDWTRNSGQFNQFKLIFVESGKIELRTIKVDNASSVGEVSNNDPFTLPANLDVFNPSNGSGDVVTIYNKELSLAGGSTTTIIEDENIVVDNLDIETNATLVVKPGGSLETSGSVISNGTLQLESVSDKYSSLIVTGTSTGNVEYKRHVNKVGTSNSGGNDLVSPPVSGQSWSAFLSANGTALADNGATGPTTYAFGPYNNTTNPGYENYNSNTSISLLSGKGYRAATSDIDETLNFEGDVLTGDKLVTISSPAGGSKWNLIGNPYTSYISFYDFFESAKNELDPSLTAIYGYNDNTTLDPYSDGIWTIWDLNNANYSSDIYNIAPGQGFFVASKSGGGSFSFTSTMRRTGDSDDFIQSQRTISENFAHIKLILSRVSGINSTNIYFRDFNSRGLDPGYDTGAFQGNAEGIFTHLLEDNLGIEMANQSLPYDDISNIIVPIGIKSPSGVQISISLEPGFTLPNSTKVYLEDNETNQWTLLNTDDYVFTPATNLSNMGRFFAHFTTGTLSFEENFGNDESQLDDLKIYVDNKQKELIINGLLDEKTLLKLYDLRGKIIIEKDLDSNKTENYIDISFLGSGIYIAELNSFSSAKRIQKLIIK